MGKKSILGYANTDFSFSTLYQGWRNELMSKIIDVFEWECDVPYHEIEKILLLNGTCGVARYKNSEKLTAFYGQPNGYSEYFDIFKRYSLYSPSWSKTLDVGKDVVYGNNNSMCTSEQFVIHQYATKLAHIDITIVNVLIYMRDFGNTPVLDTEREKQSFLEYRNSLVDGKVTPFIAKFGEVTSLGGVSTHIDINSLYILQENILSQFFLNYGIRSGIEKKANMISEEFTSGLPRLKNSLSDRLRCRQIFCNAVNELFNVNWSVKVNPIIDLSGEDVETNE